MSATLSCEGVAVRLDGRAVLRGVDLAVQPGEVVALAGRNGAGKTTLLRVVTRRVTPEAGAVRVAGRPVADYSRRELARVVGVVPQESSFPFPFRVSEVVLMGRSPRLGWLGFEGPEDLEAARAAMDRVGIGAFAERSILELSGGERQLAVLARALAQDPELLLLDEPTAFLDLKHRVDVLRVVRELANAGRAVLVVTHDLGLASRFCDRLVLLTEGAVLAAGPPAEVLTPDRLRRAFDVEADVVAGPDGIPLVLPRPC